MTGSQISLPVPAPLPPAPGTGRHHTRAGVSQPGAQELIPAGGGETATGMSPTFKVCGIDLSLTATGAALPDGTTRTIRTGPGQHLADQHDRLIHIAAEVLAAVGKDADLAVIEGPSYGSKGAGTWDRAGLWWLTIDRLFAECISVVVIPPAVVKRYATGKGNATKPDMRMALFQRAELDLRDDNQVDAWWLRAMGLDYLGHPVVDLPKVQRAALDKVRWPELVTA